MSILRHFNKHHGYDIHGKRTPFGGGGDIFQSIGAALAPLDPHITEGTGDWMIENGWVIPLAMATMGAGAALGGGAVAAEGALEGGTLAAGGEVAADGTVFAAGETIPAGTAMADGTVAGSSAGGAGDVFGGYSASGSSAGTAGTTVPEGYSAAVTSGQSAYDAAIANGASQAEAQAAGDAAYNSSLSSSTQTPGANSVLSQPDVTVNLGGNSSGSFGSLNPSLPAQGSVGGAGAGMSAELAPGTVLGTGAPGGGEIGVSYAAGANGLPATDFFGNYIPASSINTGGVPDTIAGTTGTSTNTDLAKLLKQGAGSGLSKSLGQLAQGANPMGSELLQAVRSNQNPFTYTQNLPIQNKKPDLSSLAELLKQG